MNSVDILRRMTEKYLSCRSYSDSGIAEFNDLNQIGQKLQFRTEFISPDYIKFEWQDYGPRRGLSKEFSLLRSEKNRTELRRNSGNIDSSPSVELGVAAATGCSAGAASIVPPLLMPQIGTNLAHASRSCSVIAEKCEMAEGSNCYVLKGWKDTNSNWALWISKEDFGLRRVRRESQMTAEESEEFYNALKENDELIARLGKRGISLPETAQHLDSNFSTTYTYRDVLFDSDIVRMSSLES